MIVPSAEVRASGRTRGRPTDRVKGEDAACGSRPAGESAQLFGLTIR